jgi:hypothetical protein
LPAAPNRGPGLFRTVLGWTVATLVLAVAPVIVEPTLLDPLCDDYEWAGAQYAVIAREIAWDAHASLDASGTAATTFERLPAPPAMP